MFVSGLYPPDNYVGLIVLLLATGRILDSMSTKLKAGQTKFTVYRHKVSILHAGGRSLSRFQTTRETRMAICSSSRSPEPRPLIRALERVRPKRVYLLYWI